jgi:prepilin-type N-terminal cleavage/methylation domain-containing protein
MNKFTPKAIRLNRLTVIQNSIQNRITKQKSHDKENFCTSSLYLRVCAAARKDRKTATTKGKKDSSKKAAFTLAEVLITILVIAVIATFTIPTLALRLRNKVLETQFKNTYAKVTQAIKRTEVELDMTDIGTYCRYNNGKYANAEECYTAFRSAFNTNIVSSWSAGAKPINRYNAIATFGDATIMATSSGCSADLINQYALSNGTYLGFYINCGHFLIAFDTNGGAKPNRLGYDVFMFYIADTTDKLEGFQPSNVTEKDLQNYWERLVAQNYSDKDYYYSVYGNPCSRTSTQTLNGIGCAYYAIRNKCPDGGNKGYFECLK